MDQNQKLQDGMGNQPTRLPSKQKRNSSPQSILNDPFMQSAFLIHESMKLAHLQQNQNFAMQPYNSNSTIQITQRNNYQPNPNNEDISPIPSGRETPDFRSTQSRNQIYRKNQVVPRASRSMSRQNLKVQESPSLGNNQNKAFNAQQLFSPQSTGNFGSTLDGSEIKIQQLFSPQSINTQNIHNIFGVGDRKFPKLKPINVSKKISRQSLLKKLQKQLNGSDTQSNIVMQSIEGSLLGGSKIINDFNIKQQGNENQDQQQNQNHINTQKYQENPVLINPLSRQSMRSTKNQNSQQYSQAENIYKKMKDSQIYAQPIHQNKQNQQISNEKDQENIRKRNKQYQDQNVYQDYVKMYQSTLQPTRHQKMTETPNQINQDQNQTQNTKNIQMHSKKSGSAIQKQETDHQAKKEIQNLQKSNQQKRLTKSQSQCNNANNNEVFSDRYGIRNQNLDQEQEFNHENNDKNYEFKLYLRHNYVRDKDENKMKMETFIKSSSTQNKVKSRNQISILDSVNYENTSQTNGNFTARQKQNEKHQFATNGSQSARLQPNLSQQNQTQSFQLPKIERNQSRQKFPSHTSNNSGFNAEEELSPRSTNQNTTNTQQQLKRIIKQQEEIAQLSRNIMNKQQKTLQPQSENLQKVNSFRANYLAKVSEQKHLTPNFSEKQEFQSDKPLKSSRNLNFDPLQVTPNQVNIGYQTERYTHHEVSEPKIDVRQRVHNLRVVKPQQIGQNSNYRDILDKQPTSPPSLRYDTSSNNNQEQSRHLNFQPQQNLQIQQVIQPQSLQSTQINSKVQPHLAQKHAQLLQSQNGNLIEEEESREEDDQDEVAFIEDKQNKLNSKNLELFNKIQVQMTNKRRIDKIDAENTQIQENSSAQATSQQLQFLQQIQNSNNNRQNQPQLTSNNYKKSNQNIQIHDKIRNKQPSQTRPQQHQTTQKQANINNRASSQKAIEVDEAYSSTPMSQPLYKVMSSQVMRNAVIHEDDEESVLSSRLPSRQ
eukprot:403338876